MGDVEEVVHPEVASGEELLAPGVTLARSDLVVVVDCQRKAGRGQCKSAQFSNPDAEGKRTRLLEDLGLDAHLFGQLLPALEPLHQSSTAVVLAVPGTKEAIGQLPLLVQSNGGRRRNNAPLDLLARLAVQHQPDGELAVLPHLTRDVVSSTELVAESHAGVVEQETADSSKRCRKQFGREEGQFQGLLLDVDERASAETHPRRQGT